MSNPKSSDLLRSAMNRNNISEISLVERVHRDEAMSRSDAASLVKLFVDGGPCSLGVAAALITIIADRKAA